MASVQDILAINNRAGDSVKGGGQTYGVTIDASPFQRLAEYTYLDNVQKQKDKTIKDQAIATEMGTAMALDPNSTNKELYESLNKKKDEINYLIKNNLDVFDYNKNPAANIKLKELLGEFTANRAKASAFDVLNNSTVTAIGALPPEQQVSAQKVLENKRKIALVGGADNFFKTGVQLDTGIMDFKAKDFKLPKIARLEYTTVDIGGDNNFTTEAKVIDINVATAKAEQIWLGIQQDKFVPQPNPTNDPKIALQNENARIQSEATSGEKGKYSEQTLDKMNTLLSEYKQKKAEWDANPIPGKEPQKTSQMIAIDAVNKNIIAASAALGRARLKDPTLKVPDFKTINYEDGLSGPELILLDTLSSQEAGFVEYSKKAVNTGNATTQRGQDISAETAREARRIAALKNGGKEPGTAGYEDGNDFDQIQNHKYPKGTQIKDGVVLNSDKSLYTGEIQVPVGKIPTSVLNTIKQLNKEDSYKQIEDGFVTFYVKDGVFNNVGTEKGGVVTRQNQLAGQRNFDKRTKEEKQNAFGNGSGAINRTWETPQD